MRGLPVNMTRRGAQVCSLHGREDTMKMFKIVYTFCFVGLVTMIAACGNGPISADEADELVDGVRAEEPHDRDYDDDYRRSSSSYSYHDDYYYRSSSSYDYWEDDYYRSSSSIGEISSTLGGGFDYLTSSVIMHLSLTHFKQLSKNWDNLSGSHYSDGDPKINFKICFEDANENQISCEKTKDLLGKNLFYKENVGEWNGEASLNIEVPQLTQKITFHPSVVDVDDVFDDDYSSNYSYYWNDVGTLKPYQTLYGSDSGSKSYELEWKWYLYK